MEEFPYYGLSWFFYLVFAAIFLLLSSLKTRGWPVWVRIPLLTFIAAMALTPGLTLSGETWWSPAAIIMIFELDQKGLSGIWRGALSILAFWLLFMLVTFVARWRLSKRRKTAATSGWEGNFSEQPELKDPD